jgi:integrase/recombinase XerC
MITTLDVELARNLYLLTHKPASANHWLRIVKMLTMWAVKRGMLAAMPWQVSMLKVQKHPRSILPRAAARAWFSAVDEANEHAPGIGTAVRLMFGLCLREGEVITARWEWIDWARKTYTLGITKGREAEPVPMAGWLREHLMVRCQPTGLIVASQTARPLHQGLRVRRSGEPMIPAPSRGSLRTACAARSRR